MKKVVFLLFALVLSGTVLAGKRRPVRLGHYDHRVANAYLNRSALYAPVEVFQDENILQVCSDENLMVTLCFLGVNNEVLSEESLSGNSNRVEIPAESTAVIVYVGDSAYIGMLH